MTTGRLTRRDLVVGAGALVVGGAAGTVLLDRRLLGRRGAGVDGLPLFDGPFPRAFSFRQSEALAGQLPYAEWDRLFGQLGGIMGKVLHEERVTIGSDPLTYFRRYRREHADKMVVVHYNGRARRPDYRTGGWYAGDWLYRAGTTVVGALDEATTSLEVLDTSVFGQPTADLVITGRTADGRPDFGAAEHVTLTATGAGAIRVIRAAYGGRPRSFPAGAYVAQHETVSPTQTIENRLWLYNLSTRAPRGPDGRSAAQRIAAEMAADFGRGGPLHGFDGVQLDVFELDTTARLDADGDGVADGAVFDGTDTYVAGEAVLTRLLREAIGTDRVVCTDGGGDQRPDPASVCGIEEEGFPTLDDGAAALWSQALARLGFWQAVGGPPRLTYPLVKADPAGPDAVPAPRFRLALAASLLAGTQLSFADEPAVGAGPAYVVWDELLGGALRRPGWLGAPAGPAVRMALAAPEARVVPSTGGAGAAGSTLLASAVATGGRLRVGAGSLTVTPASPAGATVRLGPVRTPGADLVVAFAVTGAAADGLPPTLGRQVTVRIGGARPSVVPVGPGAGGVVVSAHGIGAAAVPVTITVDGPGTAVISSPRAHAHPDVAYRAFEHGAVFVNPSLRAYAFPVAALLPGRRFRRLTATAGQDARTNDGSPVGAVLTVPAGDAVVVRVSP